MEIRSGEKLASEWTPVVVARSTAYGTFSASLLIADWPSGLRRPWLVVVADAPVRTPESTRFFLRTIRDRTAGIAQVPYLHRLRGVISVGDVLHERAVAKASATLRHRLSVPD